MNKNLSIYLDFVRFVAAIGVFLGHSRALMAPSIPKILAVHASECVVLFFVLSGFVIRYVSRAREQTLGHYAAARAIRLYSVAVPAILLTLVLDIIGAGLAPAHYNQLSFFDGSGRPAEVLTSLAFLNEAWGIHVVVGTNEAYWSLGFEAAYYIAFCAVFMASAVWRMVFLVLWAAVFGPQVVAYGALWLLGAVLYDAISQPGFLNRITPRMAWALFGCPIFYPVLKYGLFPPVGSAFRHYDLAFSMVAWLYAALLSVLVARNIVGAARLLESAVTIDHRIARSIRWLAGATFTIYLTHQPLVVFVSAVGRSQERGAAFQYAAVALVFVLLLLLAECGERRKPQIKAAIRMMSASKSDKNQ